MKIGLHHQRFCFAVILSLATIGQVLSDLYLSSFPALAKVFNVPFHWVQWSLTVYMLGFALSQLFYGPLSDTVGRRPPLLGGLLLCLVGIGVSLYATNIEWFWLGRLLQGLGGGVGLGLSRAILRDLYGGEGLARYSSFLAIGNISFMASAPFVGSYLQYYLGWQSCFVFLGLYTLIILLGVVVFPETHPRASAQALRPAVLLANVKTLLAHRSYRAYIVILFLAYGSISAWLVSGPILVHAAAGLNELYFGWMMLMNGIGYAIGSLINARVVKRYHYNVMLGVGLLLTLFGGVMTLLFGFTAHANIVTLGIGPFLYFSGSSMVFANVVAGALTPFKDMAGIAGAVLSFCQISGGVIISGVVAAFKAVNQIPLGAAFVVLTLCGIALYFKFVWGETEPAQIQS